MDYENRFMRFVKKSKTCWIWTGSRLTSGYGQFTRKDANERWKKGLSVQEGAHRCSYKHFKNDIPRGFMVRHLCNNKLCVNPDHLSIGTQKDNMNDFDMSSYAKKRVRNIYGQFVTMKNTDKLREGVSHRS